MTPGMIRSLHFNESQLLSIVAKLEPSDMEMSIASFKVVWRKMLSEDAVIYNRTGFKGGHVMVDTCSYSPLLRFEDGIPFHFSLFHFVGRPFLWPALKPVRV